MKYKKLISGLAASSLVFLFMTTIASRPTEAAVVAQQEWRFKTQANQTTSPTVGTDGTLYFGSRDRHFYALWPNGTVKWQNNLDISWSTYTSIASDGTVYAGADQVDGVAVGRLFAFNPNGTIKWTFDTAHPIPLTVPAVGSDGTIYIVSVAGEGAVLQAVNPDSTLKWQKVIDSVSSTGNAIPGSIDLNGIMYIGADNGILSAINTVDGSELWNLNLDGAIRSSVAIGSDGSLFLTAGSKAYSVNSSTHTVNWIYTIPSGVAAYTSPTLGSDGTVYFGAQDGNFYALNPDGTVKWTYATGSSVLSTSMVSSNNVNYFGSNDGNFYAIDGTGILLWQFTTGGGISGAPNLDAEGTIYFGSNDTYMYAVNEFDDTPVQAPLAMFGVTSAHAASSRKISLAKSSWPKFRQNQKNTGNLNTLNVDLNVDPQHTDNVINLQGNSKGKISVAILSSRYFNPSDINKSSLTFGSTGDELSFIGCNQVMKDTNKDGIEDLVCNFDKTIGAFSTNDTEVVLKGKLNSGKSFIGSDYISIKYYNKQ